MLRHAAFLVLLLFATTADAGSLVRGGYQEAVFSVSSLDDFEVLFTEVAGWAVLHRGQVGADVLGSWRLPPGAGAGEVVLGNPGTTRGFVRLVQFAGVPQLQIRSNAAAWDTGGWFDVNSRVTDMQRKFVELQSRGWQAYSDPVEFRFGPFVVEEWLARGPDGIVIALIERIAPPLSGWPQLREMSRFFNATQIVPDIDAAREFYIDKLGFRIYLEHTGPSEAPGPNVLGLPYELAAKIPRRVTIVHPEGSNEGSIELLQFDGLTGRDWSERARPPNLGILALRFPVADLDAFAARMHREDVEIATAPAAVDLPPYGRLSLMAIRGPGGARIEFYERETP